VLPAERRAAVDWMRRTLLELLSRSAIDEQDVALAQRLVASPQGSSGTGTDKSELLLLATRGTLEKTISGRTLGLALELGDAQASQRSIDVAAGIALTLDLAAPMRDDDPVLLTTRQVEDGDMGDALARLSGDGASLLVAGFDPSGARQAADFAAQSGIPVLLLHEPSGSEVALAANVYVLGADSTKANDVLNGALEQRFRGVLRIGPDGHPCPSGDAETSTLLERAAGPGRRARLEFDTDASCARGVLMHLSGATRPLALGFGLDALAVAWESPAADEVWAVGAGRLPRFEGARDALTEKWLARKGRPPTWSEGLGHDAALIASAAIGPSPERSLRDTDQVRARYREVGQRLASERLTGLWTSDADRFDAARRLPREFRAVRLAPASTESGR
jgi:hypothetical protein